MVQVGGLATGLDVNSIVGQLVGAEITPAQARIDSQEASFQADISSLGLLKGALNDFKTAVEGLDTLTDLRPRTATSSNTDLFTISASDAAVEGEYDISVTQLATEQRLKSSAFASPATNVGSGTLTIQRGTDSFTVTIDPGAQTLEDIRAAINSAENNPGVRASIINVDDGANGTDSRLIVTAGDVGPDNALTITATDDDGIDTDDAGLSQLVYPPSGGTNVMTEDQAALPSIITMFNETVTRSTNTITDAITGVTIDLLAETSPSGNSGTVSIALDKGGVSSKINDFVDAYNSLVDTLDSLGGFDAATETGGALLGDPTLRAVFSAVRRELSTGTSEPGLPFTTLAEIGVTTGRDGRLSVDSADLQAALDNSFDDVGQLFASSTGYAARLSSVIDDYAGSNGAIDTRVEGLNGQLDRLADDRVALDRRAQALDTRFRNQFAALDELVSQLNSVSTFLSQNLANLPGFSRQSRS